MKIERLTLCMYKNEELEFPVVIIRQHEKDEDSFFVRKRGGFFKTDRKNLTPIFQIEDFARRGVELLLERFLGEGVSDVNMMVMIDQFLCPDDVFSQQNNQ